MTVKQLKQELEGADDNLEVFIVHDDTFDPVSTSISGVIEFGDPCDENGEPVEIPEDWDKFNKAFALFPMTDEECDELCKEALDEKV